MMNRRGVSAARRDALFVSPLQPSQHPGPQQVRQAVAAAARRFGERGCAGLVAHEFGEHPEAAAARMLWARQAIARAFAPTASPACRGARRVSPALRAGVPRQAPRRYGLAATILAADG